MTKAQTETLHEIQEAVRSAHTSDEAKADLACALIAAHARLPDVAYFAVDLLTLEKNETPVDRIKATKRAYDLLVKDGWVEEVDKARFHYMGSPSSDVYKGYRLTKQATSPLFD